MSECRLLLTRDLPQPERTFGVLSDALSGEELCHTMEPGIRDRAFPRVPTGFYSLVPHISDQEWIGSTYALVGQVVAHYPTPGIDRFSVLIHAGNRDDDTEGCIIPGFSRGELYGEPAVLSSRPALEFVLEKIRSADRAYLTIR